MKRYTSYKDSGVEWLGEIPEHWELIRLKYIFQEVNLRSETGNEILLSMTRNHGLIPQSEMTEKPPSAPTLVGYKLCNVGEIVMNKMQAWNGMFSIVKIPGVVSPDYTVFKPCKSLDIQYYIRLFKTPRMIDIFHCSSKGLGTGFFRLYTPDFGNIVTVYPPPEEQKAIAHFLDHKLEQIEQYIRNKKRLIELLNEQKTAIINRAVTKGINPNVPMKYSGIEWLGEIPAHWEVKRNKYIFKEVNERSTTGQETYLAMSQRLGLVERSQIAEQHLSTSENQIGYKLCQVNDLILNKLKAYLGVFFKASVSGLVSPDYTVFRPIADIEVEYFEYLFKTPGYIAEFNRLSTGIVIGFFRLYTPDFYTSYSIFPPVEEQTKIVNYIKHESTQIDLAIAQIEKEIELIQEYRTTLISDAVTGKIDVRGFDNSSNSKNSPKPPELATM